LNLGAQLGHVPVHETVHVVLFQRRQWPRHVGAEIDAALLPLATAIAERWRSGLHALVAQLNEAPPSQRRLMEQRILDVVSRKKNPTATDVTNYIRNLSTSEAQRILNSLVKAGILETEPTYKGTLRYSIK
jgi:hypothetical protein